MLPEEYRNKIVLITGSSRGVGRLITDHFLSGGSTVIGVSRSATTISHENYTHFSVDIGSPEQVIKMFREIQKTYKKIDLCHK